jgi:hypothetical protein
MEVVDIPPLDLDSIISVKNLLKRVGLSGTLEGTLERSHKNTEGETLRFSIDRRSRNKEILTLVVDLRGVSLSRLRRKREIVLTKRANMLMCVLRVDWLMG